VTPVPLWVSIARALSVPSGIFEGVVSNHKLAEGTLKALPLAGAPRLAALQARLADFPPALRRAMIEHALLKPALSWRGIAQLPARDTTLW
jgi:hypothetical protein